MTPQTQNLPSNTSDIRLDGNKEKILKLLGEGHGPEVVSNAVGVSIGYVSQLLSDPIFAQRVAELRVLKLAKHSERDSMYDDMETVLAKKFHDLIPFMMDPMKILKSLREINALKRRGSSSQDAITNQQTVVQLNMPTTIINTFVTNVNNQVIKAGGQDFLTVQSGSLAGLAAKMRLKNEATQIPYTGGKNNEQ